MSKENVKLKQNLEDQLKRLVHQLADLEECKDDLDTDEYECSKRDTLEQLKEFDTRLTKLTSGDITVDDQIAQLQRTTQAAISEAFKTPAVIKMFANKEPELLRQRLNQIERDAKLGKQGTNFEEKLEVLRALRHLNEHLNPDQLQFIMNHETKSSTASFDEIRTLPL
uniref:Protein LZIC n=1 Tax=Cacopsylla melanoneura TaxID=428564 RepID=A0A8D8YPG9_9HEMI